MTSVILSGLMKDHGQEARANENFAEPVDFETPRQIWPWSDIPTHCVLLTRGAERFLWQGAINFRMGNWNKKSKMVIRT